MAMLFGVYDKGNNVLAICFNLPINKGEAIWR